jgi:hypothetical protein
MVAIGDGKVEMAGIGGDGKFEIRGLRGPTRFTLGPGAQGSSERIGLRLKSVSVGSVNAAEESVHFAGVEDSRTDVTVVVSDDVATITGEVTENRRALGDYRVIAFPVAQERWWAGSPYVRIEAGPNADGRFEFRDVSPGDYWLVAVDAVDGDATAGEWQSPEFLRTLTLRARRVVIGERQNAVVDLTLVRR